MRDTFRAAVLLLRTGWRAYRVGYFSALADISAILAMPLIALATKLAVDAVTYHQPGKGYLAAVVIGTVLGSSLVILLSGQVLSMNFTDRVAHAFDQQVNEILATLPPMAAEQDPEIASHLALLREQEGALGQSVLAVVRVASTVLGTIFTVVLAISVSPWLLLVALSVVVPLATTPKTNRWFHAAYEQSGPSRQLAMELHGLTLDPDAGAELRTSGAYPATALRFREAWQGFAALRLSAWRRGAVVELGSDVVQLLTLLLALLFVAREAIEGRSTPGDVVLTFGLITHVQSNVAGAFLNPLQLGRELVGARQVIWLSDRAKNRSDPSERRPAPERLDNGIELHDVTFTYAGAETPSLRGVSLALPAGSTVALVGENGAGKSTLVKLLLALQEPTSGDITVDGTPLRDIDPPTWAARATAAFQDFARLELLAKHSVGVGDLGRLDDTEQVHRAANRGSADSMISELPGGWDAMLGADWDNGQELSVGQWQKVAVARSFMRDAALLTCFDEPSASLDAAAEHRMFSQVAEQARLGRDRGAITVLVSHRFSTASMADLIVVLDDGKVVEQGTHDELIRLDGRYAELFEMQASSFR